MTRQVPAMGHTVPTVCMKTPGPCCCHWSFSDFFLLQADGLAGPLPWADTIGLLIILIPCLKVQPMWFHRPPRQLPTFSWIEFLLACRCWSLCLDGGSPT